MAQPEEVPHGWMYGRTFALLKDVMGSDFTGRWDKNGPICTPHPFLKGDKVKVVMVSRFGDCGITHDLDRAHGYQTRVPPEDLEEIK